VTGLARFLFGYDIFISYAYSDGRQYAGALEDKLANLDFSCFFDRKELPYGDVLTSSLRRAIRRSKALVLVGTSGALDAPYVKVEFFEALKRRRTKVIPIDIDGIRQSINVGEAGDLIWINEAEAAARAKCPSAAVLEGIGNHFRFTRRNTIARRGVGMAAVFFLVLSIVSVWQWRVAVAQRDTAISRELAAKSKLLGESEPAGALLVAVEAALLRNTFEARDALLGALTKHPGLITILHEAGQVRHVVFSHDGRYLVSFTGSAATVWDLTSRPVSGRPATPEEIKQYSIAPEPDGDKVAMLLTKISESGVQIRAHAVSADGKVLAVSDNQRVTLWKISTGERMGEPRLAQQEYVRTLAFSPAGLLASGSNAGTIALWQLAERPPIGYVLEGLSTSANSVVFDSDGSRVAAGDYNGDVLVWQIPDGKPAGRRLRHRSTINAVRFCEGGGLLSAGGSEVIRWNLNSGQPEGTPRSLPPHAEVAISPDCGLVALGSNDGQVQFLNVATGQFRRPARNAHGDRTFALAFSPDTGTLASGGNDRNVVLWDIGTLAASGPPLTGHTSTISGLQFSGDGERLASLDSNGTLTIWDTRTRQQLGTALRRNKEYAAQSALALSSDGGTAATSTKGGLVNLWDVATWRPLGRPLPGHPGGVVAISFAPRGDWMASASLGGTVILWDLRTDTWIEAARRMSNRNLSAREKAIHLGVE
jgi:WD40 repeat protein